MSVRYKTIVFDVDGTLFDTKPGIFDALENAFDYFGIGLFDRDIGDRYIGPPIIDSMVRFHELSYMEAERFTRYYRKTYLESYIGKSKLYDGIRELLHRLKMENYNLAIATNKTYAQVEKLFSLGEIPISDFRQLKTALENGRICKTEMLLQIADAYGDKESIVMIGDTNRDLTAANEASVDFIGVTYGYGFKGGYKYGFSTVESPKQIYEIVTQEM
jgi:phosphoglycolate phosphatase